MADLLLLDNKPAIRLLCGGWRSFVNFSTVGWMGTGGRPYSVFIFLFFLAVPHLRAETIPASTCSQTDVQKAIEEAQNGDTVQVPAGNCTWTTLISNSPAVSITREINLIGAGIDTTVIQDDTTGTLSNENAIQIDFQTPTALRISGFTFEGVGSKVAVIKFNNNGNAQNWRIDHIEFDANKEGRGIAPNGYGVIDHCQFKDATQAIDFRGENSWEAQVSPGSESLTYVEDSTFLYSNDDLDGANDAHFAASYVFRFNTITNSSLGNHGNCSPYTQKSTRWYEYYGNTSVANIPIGGRFYHLRGGTGFVFNNSVTDNYSSARFCYVNNYRSCETHLNCTNNGGTYCDGRDTVVGDFNLLPNGYPCYGQIGRKNDGPDADLIQDLEPLVGWNNTKNGNITGMTISDDCPRVKEHIQWQRDVYDDQSHGVLSGLWEDRPETCTENQYYWATDRGEWNSLQTGNDGELYRCHNRIWESYYRPYTYPHPLASGAKAFITVANSGLESLRIFPNPWRSDRHDGSPIAFDSLPVNTTIKIFTIAGEHVTTLPIQSGENMWDLKDKSGDPVVSGIYLYAISSDGGDNKKGRIAVIR